MDTKHPISRLKAAAIHLGISAIVATIIVALMLRLWYPPPYFEAMGGSTLVLLIAGCDVVIGPLITLIVFKSGKKGLKFDLTTIGCMQLAALAYGCYTMFVARPAFTVFAVDRFEVVAANDIRPEELGKASSSEFSQISLTGPRVVGARVPNNAQESMQITMEALKGGNDIQNLPRLYVPYESIATEAGRRAKPLSRLEMNSPTARATLRQVVPGIEINDDRWGFLPLNARMKSMAVIVERNTGRILAIVDANPW